PRPGAPRSRSCWRRRREPPGRSCRSERDECCRTESADGAGTGHARPRRSPHRGVVRPGRASRRDSRNGAGVGERESGLQLRLPGVGGRARTAGARWRTAGGSVSNRDPRDRLMMPDESFEELWRVLDTRVRSETQTPDCLSDDMIAALADGSLTPKLRADILPHVGSCPRCRAAVASVARALADPTVARELSVSARGRRWYRLAVPLAAAAVLLLLLSSP